MRTQTIDIYLVTEGQYFTGKDLTEWTLNTVLLKLVHRTYIHLFRIFTKGETAMSFSSSLDLARNSKASEGNRTKGSVDGACIRLLPNRRVEVCEALREAVVTGIGGGSEG